MPFYDASNYTVDRSLGFLVLTVSRLINDDLDELLVDRLDIGVAQWRVLALLRHGLAATASELCHALKYDSGAMTRMVDKLESLGLAARQDAAGDRRAYRLQLTAKGRRLCDQGSEIARENLNLALADLGNSKAELLVELLQTVKATVLARRSGKAATPSKPAKRARRT